MFAIFWLAQNILKRLLIKTATSAKILKLTFNRNLIGTCIVACDNTAIMVM